ncbi:hypothetical protein L873DRAFT_1668632, partial [Choiromyces venosus 120613-1]
GTYEFVTVIEGVCADGTALNPTIILKAKEFIAEWFKKVKGSCFTYKVAGEFQLLIFNGYSSYVNIEFLEFCISQKIIPDCLPPHTTHRLQPLDISIFSLYKHQYQKELTHWFENHEYGVSKENFYEILMVAHRASFTKANIQSGFLNTGLVSVNRSIIVSKIQALNPKSYEYSSTTTNSSTPQLQVRSPSPLPLSTFSAQQIDKLGIPSTKREIERQELIALATLPQNGPIECGLKKIVSNLAISANRLHMQDEENDCQLENLKQ